MSESEQILFLKWIGTKFQITPSLLGDDVPQLLLLDKEKVGISYFPPDLPKLEKLNVKRQMDSIKRLGIENPETRKRYRIEKIIEVFRTFTLQNVVRTVRKNENYVKALDFETSSFDISQREGDSPTKAFVDSDEVLFEKEISPYKMLLQVSSSNVLIFSLETKDLISSKALPGVCSSVEPDFGRGTKYKLIIDGRQYELEISLLEFVNEVRTKALFIHSLGFENGLGYYAGSYEAGLFKTSNGKLIHDKIIKSEKVTHGMYDFSAQLFLISKMYQVNCYQTNWDSDPELNWTTLVPEMTQGMAVSKKELGNFLFTGHKDGTVQFRELLTGKLIHTYPYDGDPIRYLAWVDGDIVAAFEKGGLFRISKDGYLRWRSYLSVNSSIVGLTYANSSLWITNTSGTIFKIDPVNGKIVEHYKGLHEDPSSAIAIYKGEWLIYDHMNHLAWQHLQDTSLSAKVDVGDTKIRAITVTDNGVVIGEDSGKLLFFKSPGIILKEL
ncbi:MAG: Outer membrane protein assembly factor BamB [Candidatus Heimdallarchaeota archaeon LC_3]|nr:MAG: Outer membrane protein assembly factor BamB [Candidatus Heimdallarchaeota archaeon LC_3]